MSFRLPFEVVRLKTLPSCIARRSIASMRSRTTVKLPLGSCSRSMPPTRPVITTPVRYESTVRSNRTRTTLGSAPPGTDDGASPSSAVFVENGTRTTSTAPSLTRIAPTSAVTGSGSTIPYFPAVTASAPASAPAPAPAPAPAAATTAFPRTSTSPTTDGRLDWNTFFRLRKVRRWYHLVTSVFTAFGTTTVGVAFMSRFDVDALEGQTFGLDPLLFLGLATVGCGALGWVIGPFAGNVVFNTIYRRQWRQISEKEKGFYARIKRYRVDPSAQSFSNPVPDYYGEKIGSVADYRQWLKDQGAYNKKKQFV